MVWFSWNMSLANWEEMGTGYKLEGIYAGGIFLVSSQPSALMHAQTGVQAQRGLFWMWSICFWYYLPDQGLNLHLPLLCPLLISVLMFHKVDQGCVKGECSYLQRHSCSSCSSWQVPSEWVWKLGEKRNVLMAEGAECGSGSPPCFWRRVEHVP